jgi:hypothetical protein
MRQTPLKRKSPPRPTKGISPASKEQRAKANSEPCVVSGFVQGITATVDPAHLVSRAQGGCDDPLCVVPLERVHHRLFDDGRLDLLPYLVKERVPELQHALGHLNGDLISLLQRLTGRRWEAV